MDTIVQFLASSVRLCHEYLLEDKSPFDSETSGTANKIAIVAHRGNAVILSILNVLFEVLSQEQTLKSVFFS